MPAIATCMDKLSTLHWWLPLVHRQPHTPSLHRWTCSPYRCCIKKQDLICVFIFLSSLEPYVDICGRILSTIYRNFFLWVISSHNKTFRHITNYETLVYRLHLSHLLLQLKLTQIFQYMFFYVAPFTSLCTVHHDSFSI